MKRRTLLLATASAATTATLGGACSDSPRPRLEVRFLEQSLPLRIIKVFRREQNQAGGAANPAPQLSFEADSQLASLFRTLQTWQSAKQPQPPLWRRWLPNTPQPQPPDLFTLGDGWLQAAIAQKLIQPLPIAELPGWQKLPRPWQQLAQRNEDGALDAAGQIWGVPYRTQPLIMAYSERAVRALGRAPARWADLWDGALAGRIALPDSPRLVMGIVLKKLGQSVNATEQFADAEVQRELQQLLGQAKVFDSETSLKALINEDVWVVVGWSGDVLSTLQRYRAFKGCFPEEGSLCSSDFWVRPAGLAPESSLATNWISFCWSAATVREISLSTQGLSPLLFQSEDIAQVQHPVLLPEGADPLAQNEVIHPLTEAEMTALTAAFARSSG